MTTNEDLCQNEGLIFVIKPKKVVLPLFLFIELNKPEHTTSFYQFQGNLAHQKLLKTTCFVAHGPL